MDAAAAAAKAFLSSFASSKVGCYFFAGSLSAYQNVGRSRYLICFGIDCSFNVCRRHQGANPN